MKSIKSLVVLWALAVTALAFSAGSAFANTAAYTQIINSAKLTYTGGSAVAPQVVVTVDLVPSTPNVTIAAGPKVPYLGTNSPKIVDTVTVTATANGPADYTVAAAISGTPGNTTGASVSSGGLLHLGATVTTSGNTPTSVNVPAGQIASGKVNGIGTGTTIVFTSGSGPHVITNVTVSDNGDGTWKISWPVAQQLSPTDVPAVGVLVAEQKSLTLDVLPGSVTTGGSDITVTVGATVSTSNAADSTPVTALNTWSTTASSQNVTVTKYVRNFTTNAAGTSAATPFTINGVQGNYYTQGVTGKPTDVLEYVIVANNTGASDLAGSALTDQLPTNFVQLAVGVYASKDIAYIDTTGTATYLSAGTTGQASYNAPNLVVNVGNGASSSVPGTLPAGKSVTIAYQATIR